MMDATKDNLAETEKTSGSRFTQSQYVDIHCHCLAGVDDGPATGGEALELCRGLVDDGIAVVVATPHQLGRFSDCNEAGQIRGSVSALNDRLKHEDIPLTVMAGGDVRVDERVCELLEADKILTLADGGRYVLLELPHEIFIDIGPLIVGLASMGIKPIVSHPERHAAIARNPNVLLDWLGRGACLQVTSGSLLGDFGFTARKAAWNFLGAGWASFVATDAHDLRGRRPRMRAAFQQISAKLGEEVARQVCIENPLRVLEGRGIQTNRCTVARKHADERISNSS
ncbi:MAG: tyrosine-protein phosphatase [Planctomycetota bacterium]|jgi:protein-tyrosine phosphatase